MQIEAGLKEIEKLHRVKSLQTWLMLLLTGLMTALTIVVVILAVFMLQISNNETESEIGRYVVSSTMRDMAFVIDTKTGRLWLREKYKTTDLGTSEKPKRKETSTL